MWPERREEPLRQMIGPSFDISVIFATRDRAGLLESTLSHFCGLETGRLSWEVIAVDNGSTDATPAVLNRARSRLPLTVLHEPRPGKNAALNRALEAARGRLLLFTDDDVEPDSRWLTEYLAAAGRWPADSIFCGPVIPRFPPDTPEWLETHPRLASGAFVRFLPQPDEGPCDALPVGPNFALRASCLSGMRFSEAMGSKGANTDLMGGETELLARLQATGKRVIFVPSASVRHVITPNQLDRAWLLRRMFRLGRSGERFLNTESVRIFGAPRYRWRELMVTWLRYVATLARTDRERFEAALLVFELRGRTYEHLSQHQRAGVLGRLLHP
jgi:glycosyltransferase involved in cell wall biosynthesis